MPEGCSSVCSQVESATNTPKPRNARPEITRISGRAHSARATPPSIAVCSPSPLPRRRSASASATAASTASAAWISSSSSRREAPSSGPSSSAASIPRKPAAEASEIPSARECVGRYSPGSFATALITTGWASATSDCPTSAHANVSPPRRTSPPAATSAPPSASEGRNQRSSSAPAGIASTTYSSGKISASHPTAPTDTP